ncbi:uncharacterized protein [Fopius arisanus]|uniref:St5_0 protein n=2 Tax=Fopius arisanus TaxID=64838 RepID=A0A0C9R283_9HYME|nr:PREDICTED: uncharacterized protein LOC105271715 [Fopius arisanus]XP_011311734.1 PREDICTED: uncharacterized protein LOC105271715 [Fopius arisanus]XP_011311735.1 PREDICTED: uncharacterized protein LOC105271715 [Fopius arisanus]
MAYISSENGAKVTLIKKKFEKNTCDISRSYPEQKDTLRRSLSASPVKIKKNIKFNVTRQLSNPSKNIKRTPAFRGDKHSRVKHLHSPSTEKPPSLVHKNLKIFEETHEPEKIENVQKISNLDCSNSDLPNNLWEQESHGRERSTNAIESTVRTTVISRQKDIYCLRTGKESEDEIDFPSLFQKQKIENCENIDSSDIERINGVEYTRVVKPPKLSNNVSRSLQQGLEKTVDGKEDLSRRKSREDISSFLDLTQTLKAALQAPLPSGPAPKKPPRTFAHLNTTTKSHPNVSQIHSSPESPGKRWKSIFQKTGTDVTDAAPKKSVCASNIADDNFLYSKDFLKSPTSFDENTMEEKHPNVTNESTQLTKSSILHSLTDTHQPTKKARDSKKMLEKLETVLIQHQKALGPKIILPRQDRDKIPISFDSKKSQSGLNVENSYEKNDKRFFMSHQLSRAIQSDKNDLLNELKGRKNSTFDCLTSLNCASCTAYENPTFRHYLDENLSTDMKSKSEETLSASIEKILKSSECYDDSLCPGVKRLSTELTTFLEGKKRVYGNETNQERVYAEPFYFDKNSGIDITGFGHLSSEQHNYLSKSWCIEGNRKIDLESAVRRDTTKQSPELHYLCTPITAEVEEDNNNAFKKYDKRPKESLSFQSSLESTDDLYEPLSTAPIRVKAEQLLNHAFGKFIMSTVDPSTDSSTSSDTDSLASNLSLTEELTSFSEKLRLFRNRENTGKLSKEELHRSLTEKRKRYVRKVSIKYFETRKAIQRRRKDNLFDVCLLVELNLSTKVPYIKDKLPIEAEVPTWIEHFCFPDAHDWPPDDFNHNQFHSLSLMDDKGNRRFGYCIRVKPEGGPILPLAYCVITKHRASGFFHKVLQELESMHGLPDRSRRAFIEELYNRSMPNPGDSLKMIAGKYQTFPKERESGKIKAFDQEDDRRLREEKEYETLIVRCGDPRLEERDISQLFETVSNKVLILLFGSLLLERKVVLLGSKLSQLSSCVEALQSLLYPLNWPHTFIPILPNIEGLKEILAAPPPFVIGILKGKSDNNAKMGVSIQDCITVDLDTSKVICAVGDEGSILPKRFQEGIHSALQLVSDNTKHGDNIRNFLVSEAFLRVFVETCAHLESNLVTQQDGKKIFQKESFVNAYPSKTVQFFLEWFVETMMFQSFVTDYIASVEGKDVGDSYRMKLFKQRIAELRKLPEQNLLSKKTKKKTFGKFTFNF